MVPFTGGYAFSLRYDEKVVPSSVVTAEVKKRVADFEEREGYRPRRKVIKELREMVVQELCAVALIKPTTVTCFYNTTDELLFVPTTSRKLCDTVTGQLLRAVESIKSSTIHVTGVKNRLTGRLQEHLMGSGEPFGKMTVGSRCKLVAPEGGKFTFDLGDLNEAVDGLTEATRQGAQVTEIALSFAGVNFRMSDDFARKGISFDDEVTEYERDDDPHYTFSQESSIRLLLLSSVVLELCEMFGYKPPVEDLF